MLLLENTRARVDTSAGVTNIKVSLNCNTFLVSTGKYGTI